ncbi:MAG: SDR family oxidoreductase [Chloroflexi bacterium]|nr:SDR family oxidoreductase [Chloroflexota bacterium]
MVLERQVTLITGASRGFGLAAAEELTLRGHPVIATMRNPGRDAPNLASIDPELVEIAQCDVTDRSSIEAAVEAGLQRFGRIDALFNNAGYGLYGPVEDLSDDEVSRQMDTNFIGQIRMAQAVLPQMRERQHGKIINVSSLAGRIVGPLMGLYAASKWAVEAISEALRYEVSRWNIDVTILEPGMYASDWQTTNLDVAAAIREGRSPYQESSEHALAAFRKRAATRPGSRSVATAVADIVELEQQLPMRWPIGEDTVHTIRLREAMTDIEWESRVRGDTAVYRGAFFKGTENPLDRKPR